MRYRTTFSLLEELVPLNEHLRTIAESSAKRPWWHVWESNKRWYDRQLAKWNALNEQLVKRFQPVLSQILHRLLVGVPTTELLSDFAHDWLNYAWDRLAPPSNEATVALWTAAETAANVQFGPSASSDIASLKPRFMLRGFVDELGDSDARMALWLLAYPTTAPAKDAATVPDLPRIVNAACDDLCAVLERFDDVSERSGGIITPALLVDRRAAAKQVRLWLFGG